MTKHGTRRLRVKFRTHLNLVWGCPVRDGSGRVIDKREALAYTYGFPATFYLTDRRAFVTAMFREKRGIFSKPKYESVYFEAGLQHVVDYDLKITPKVRTGFIRFGPHGMIKDGIIHFIKLDPQIVPAIRNVLENASRIKNPVKDTGIVVLGRLMPENILKERLKI